MTQKENDRLELLLIDAVRNLQPKEAIDSDDHRYVICSKVRGEEGIEVTKIEEAILRAIKADSKPKTYLFSGHSGSGKSTELKSLEKSLARKKLFTIKIDAMESLDIQDPNYIDILFAVATQMEKCMREASMPLSAKLMNNVKSWFDEVIYENSTDRNISAGLETGVEASVNLPFIAKLMAKLSGQLKYSSNERKTIRKRLEPAISELMNYINAMVGEAEKKLKAKKFLGLVIIYDNLEKIKLSYPEGNSGHSTHETIFIDNAHHLSGIHCHKIYTVPLNLLYSVEHARMVQLYDETYVLPMIKVCKDRSRNVSSDGMSVFLEVAKKRLKVDEIFTDEELIKEIALFSGGNVREFIRMLLYMVETAKLEALPFKKEDIQFTFRRIIRDYETSPTDDDFQLLAQIYKNFAISNDPDHFRLLYNHCVLAYVNGEVWYDVHPALREVRKFKQALETLNNREK